MKNLSNVTRIGYYLITLLLLNLSAFSQTAEFIPITYPGMVFPTGISSDGATVVGAVDQDHGFIWTEDDGFTFMQDCILSDVSNTGRIAGTFLIEGYKTAGYWEDGNITSLGGMPGVEPFDPTMFSDAFGISSDGNVIVGMGWYPEFTVEAYKWTEETGIVGLGQGDGQGSRANRVSDDGTLIGGWDENSNYERQFALWTTELSSMGSGEVNDISPNGLWAGGSLSATGAALWSGEDGIIEVGMLPGHNWGAFFLGVSDNGVAVGASQIMWNDTHATIWSEDLGLLDLQEYLTGLEIEGMDGWILDRATGISADGTKIIGWGYNAAYELQGWMIKLNYEPNYKPGKVENLSVIPDPDFGLSAAISWECPTLDMDGNPLTELSEVRIYRNDVLIYTDTAPEMGESGSYADEDVPESGSYNYKAVGYNSYGEGRVAQQTIWIGPNFSGIIIYDLCSQPTGSILKESIESMYDGGVILTDNLDAIQVISEAEAVFIQLGLYPEGYALAEVQVTQFVEYLNNGGNLYLSGGDTWAFDEATSLHGMFGINGIEDGSSDLVNITGQDFLQGMSWTYSGNNAYVDKIAPVGDAVSIFYNDAAEYCCGVAYEGDAYKSVGVSFDITGIGGNNTLNDAVAKILGFFGIIEILESGISGSVTLNGGSGNIVDVVITAGQAATSPDAEGNFSINIEPGTYDVSARLEGYSLVTIEGVLVEQGEITQNINFVLNEVSQATPVFTEIDPVGYPCYALGVNAGGTTVVGYAGESEAAYYWTEASGTVNLGPGEAWSISENGRIAGKKADDDGVFEAGYWEGDQFVFIGGMPGAQHDPSNPDYFSSAKGISADGTTIVGLGYYDVGSYNAFKWTEEGGMVDICPDGYINGSHAFNVNNDGSVIVGWIHDNNYSRNAAIWNDDEFIDLGWGEANGVSGNGQYITGYVDGGAFLWTQDNGLQVLGFAPGLEWTSTGLGVSDNGTVVGVGKSSVAPNSMRAWMWTEDMGMVNLKDYLTGQGTEGLENWTLHVATNISADGNTIIGWGTAPDGGLNPWKVSFETSALSGISGIVTLTGGNGNLQDVELTAGGITVNPDINGDYFIELSEGNYSITAMLEGYTDVILENVVVEAGLVTENIDIDLMGITGIAGTVTLNGGDGELQDVALTTGEITIYPNENGDYFIELGAGAHTVTVSLDGYVSQTQDVTVSAGNITDGTDFTLEPDNGINNSFMMVCKTELKGNYPNPFNPETTISFSINEPGNVSIAIYNVKGELVRILANEPYLAGAHSIVWDGKDKNGQSCSSGLYFYRFSSLDKVFTKKMVLMK